MSLSVIESGEGRLDGYLYLSTSASSFLKKWKKRYIKLVYRPTSSSLIVSKVANVPCLCVIQLTADSKVSLSKHKSRFCLCLKIPSEPEDIYLSPIDSDALLNWLDQIREGIQRLTDLPSFSSFSSSSSSFVSHFQELQSSSASIYYPTLPRGGREVEPPMSFNPMEAEHELGVVHESIHEHEHEQEQEFKAPPPKLMSSTPYLSSSSSLCSSIASTTTLSNSPTTTTMLPKSTLNEPSLLTVDSFAVDEFLNLRTPQSFQLLDNVLAELESFTKSNSDTYLSKNSSSSSSSSSTAPTSPTSMMVD